MFDLGEFILESNKIEGITGFTERDIRSHEDLLNEPKLTAECVVTFVARVAEAEVRSQPGMDVYIGNYYPPKGGPKIWSQLVTLCQIANGGNISPYNLHREYESLHPFMDGNGRSGRAIWAWMMVQKGRLHNSSFLHAWYYQSLEQSR